MRIAYIKANFKLKLLHHFSYIARCLIEHFNRNAVLYLTKSSFSCCAVTPLYNPNNTTGNNYTFV